MSWLNEEADLNMRYMLVTLDTSQAEMSLLNEEAKSNMKLMSVTSDTFQAEMWP